MTKTPVIGITPDSLDPGSYSVKPSYVLRCNYADIVLRAGGLPLLLTYALDQVWSYADHLDGLMITGGDFDIDPALLGVEGRHRRVKTKGDRTAFEWAMLNAMLAIDKPVLGICGGSQLINAAYGGDLIQDIADECPGSLQHEQENIRDEPGHTVDIVSGSLLARIVDKVLIPVNSAHHQAVGRLGEGLQASAKAPDGIIEAIEDQSKSFVLGVQWHPEYSVSPADQAVVKAFIDASR